MLRIMKKLSLLMTIFAFGWIAACSSGGSGGGSGGNGMGSGGSAGSGGNGTGGLPIECAGCTPPPICGMPVDPCACFCTDGETAQYPDGIYVCNNGCFEPQGADGGSDAGACAPTPAGRLCVRGTPDPQTGMESIAANAPIQFQVFPQGCFSSSCTKIHEASCSVMLDAAGNFAVDSNFCLENIMAPACTDDCNGGGFGNCTSGNTGVGPGNYTAVLGNLQLTFTVPSVVPAGGSCVGSPF